MSPEEDPESPPQERPSAQVLAGSGLSQRLQEMYRDLNAIQASEIYRLGGPEAYIRATAPRLLPLYPGPWTEEIVRAETTAGWVRADERLAQCAKCPPHGGTCDQDGGAPRGHLVRADGGVLSYERCQKWPEWVDRKNLITAGVPESGVGWAFARLFEVAPPGVYPMRDMLFAWTAEVAARRKPLPFVLTGGQPQERTRIACAIARAAVRGNQRRLLHYTYGPKLAAELMVHFQEKSEVSPLTACEESFVFIFDACDPKPPNREAWKPWFLEKVDQMLLKRIGDQMPTIIVSRHTKAELMRVFSYASAFADGLGELDITSSAFGMKRGG